MGPIVICSTGHSLLCTPLDTLLRQFNIHVNTNRIVSEPLSIRSRNPSVRTVTYLPRRRNSEIMPWRLIAIKSPLTVIPSQKQTTTLALGR